MVECHWANDNTRERRQSQAAVLVHTAFQRVAKIARTNELLEQQTGRTLTDAEVGKMYAEKVAVGIGCEEIGEQLVRQALAVHKVVFTNPSIMQSIQSLEGHSVHA